MMASVFSFNSGPNKSAAVVFNVNLRKGSPLISGSRMAAVSALGYSWYKDHISTDCFTEILHTANCFPLCQTSGQSGAGTGDCLLK